MIVMSEMKDGSTSQMVRAGCLDRDVVRGD